MLEITGATMSGIDAVEFLEMLPCNIPDEIKDDEFCAEYERMLNRVRAEVRKAVPLDAKVTEPKTSRFPRYYSCGKCLLTLRPEIDKYCPRCGRMIGWKSVFPERLI